MRITQAQLVSDGLANIQGAERQASVLERQVSSGEKISQASDDPAGAGRLVRLAAELASNDAAQKNATLAKGDLGSADSALQQLAATLSQARALAVQGASGTLTAQDRGALAAQANGLLQTALSIANTQVDGRSLFGGASTAANPFSVSTASGTTVVSYNGSSMSRTVPVGDATVTTGPAGPGPFAATTPGGAPGALDAIGALRDALAGNGGSAAVAAAIGGLDSALGSATGANATVGASLQNLSALEDSLTAQATQLQQVKSVVGDADMASAMAQLAQQQQVYQQGLEVLAQVMKTSILNYLSPGSL